MLVAIGLSATPAGAAAPSTVSGKLSPGKVKLPKSARKGAAQVIATNVDTLAFGAAAQVGRSGRYKLELPAGKWALRSSVVALGRPFASFPSARIVTRAGKRRSLPLTLKRFKKPRRARRNRAHRTNVNPRDGRSYPGEAFGIERFGVSGGDDISSLGRGVADMLVTDLMTNAKCEFTLVEVIRRDLIVGEQAFSQSEYVDPASKVEPGHLIDPEILIRGRVQDRPGTPRRLALIAWLVDAKTGARVSGNVSSVGLASDFFESQDRLVKLIQRDLICARATPKPAPPGSGPAAPAPGPAPPPNPPPPAAAPDTYTGTFSGEADGPLHWDWTGTVVMDAAQDDEVAPNGAPEGNYRTFSVTSGSVDLNLIADSGGCMLRGSAHYDLEPGLLSTLIVQLDAPSPAYELSIYGSIIEPLYAVRSGGPGCTGPPVGFPPYQLWATTGTTAHTSPTLSLADSQAVLTPQTPFDYDYTTRWNLTPG